MAPPSHASNPVRGSVAELEVPVAVVAVPGAVVLELAVVAVGEVDELVALPDEELVDPDGVPEPPLPPPPCLWPVPPSGSMYC
jgi:hypothetical protein